MIWDGDTNCEHKWGGNFERAGYRSSDTNPGQFQSIATQNRNKGSKSQFCSLCGAWRGCLGLEPTLKLYLKHLVGIFDEAKRVLRDDGTCFVNFGDTYASSPAGNKEAKFNGDGAYGRLMERHTRGGTAEVTWKPKKYENIPTKSLCLIPFRFAIEMVNHGWILRNTIIWSKPNPMPSSAKDRFTVDFEYVFFFVKKKKYWFEQQYDNYSETYIKDTRPHGVLRQRFYDNSEYVKAGMIKKIDGDMESLPSKDLSLGRNKRTTWTIPTEAFPEAHFATFPCALVEPMIKCGCPEFICKKCGKARVKVYDVNYVVPDTRPSSPDIDRTRYKDAKKTMVGYRPDKVFSKQNTFKGYTSCSCNAGFSPGIVLDFFCGSGTVGKVAAYLRRNYILIDAKKEYCRMAEERVKEPETGLTVAEQRQSQGSLFDDR